MTLHPRRGFGVLIKIADFLNPFIVLLSIVGLFMEYTDLKPWVIFPNQILSVIFVGDFLLRCIAFPLGKYLWKGFGWVDFLASLPGFFIFLGNTPLLSVLKVVRIGRFFRIIRILRFLRVFDFLKRMKNDSPWIQNRVMQIGITVVLIFVTGIVVMDTTAKSQLETLKTETVFQQFEANGRDVASLAALRTDIKMYATKGQLYTREGQLVTDPALYDDLVNGELLSVMEVAFTAARFSLDGQLQIPSEGLLLDAGEVGVYHNQLMLILLTTLLVILTVIIFYMGSLFARDMRVVQLIIDSFDAEDHLLLLQEAQGLEEMDGQLRIDPEEDEMVGLLKVAAKTARRLESGGAMGGLGALGGFGESFGDQESQSSNGQVLEEIRQLRYMLEDMETSMKSITRETALEALKVATPAIIKFMKKG